MLEKYDPGLITGTIGAVIGIILGFILEKTMIMLRFSKLRKNLKDKVEGLDQMLHSAADGMPFDRMKDLVKEGSEMVREERNVSRICVITRYRESNEMAKLISKIETAQSLLLLQIVIEQTSHPLQTVTSHQEQTSHPLQTLTSHREQTSSPLAPANQEQTLTSHKEQTSSPLAPADQEETSSLLTPADQAKRSYLLNIERLSLIRRMVGNRPANARKMVVLKFVMEDEKSKKRAMKAIADVDAVASIAVDMKEEKITVIGDVDPVFLTAKLRKVGIVELLSVGPAKEETKTKGDKKRY